MKRSSSLRRRILLASFAMAFVICALFSIGLFWALEYAESVLFEDRVDADISTIIRQYKINPEIISLPRENFQVFAAVNGDKSALPSYLQNLPKGADEVVLDGREFDLQVRRRADTTFYFMFDETTFDRFDQLLSVVVPAMITLICAIAIVLGFAFSNRIVKPVAALAEKVNRSESSIIPPLVNSPKSDDEIEFLAQAIDSFQARVRELLSRERDFSSDVSHELRTPLMGIQAAADNLLISSNKQERIEELSQRIQKRCAQMRALVDALLSLARDPHSLENDFQNLRLSEVVQDQVDAANPHVDSRGVNIRVIENGNPQIFSSSAILSVVIGNILRNAIIHSNSKDIHIQLTSRGLSIKDFGRGVSEDLKEKVFERYSSAGADPARDFGIGLDLVQRLCSHFHWLLSLESVPGHGTTISIDFGNSLR